MKKLLMVLFFLTAAFSFGQSVPEGLEWEIVDGNSVTITKYSGNAATVQIPEKIQGLPVTAIGNFAFAWRGITNVSIPSSVRAIGWCAFFDSNLTSINIPSSVKAIGVLAFSRCENLTSINIPSSVTDIGESAFHKCENLTSVTLSIRTKIGEGAFPVFVRIIYMD